MKNYFLFMSFILLFATCKKQELPPPIQPVECWQKFIGSYTVYDTSNSTSHTMTISYEGIDETYVAFKLKLMNLNNQFDFTFLYDCQTIPSKIDIGSNVNVIDHNGHHFNVWDSYDDTSTVIEENLLNNDTLVLYFNYENTAYWVADGIPYQNIKKHLIAVKNH